MAAGRRGMQARQLPPARRQHLGGRERRHAQDAVEIVAPAGLERAPECRRAIDDIGRGDPAPASDAVGRRVPTPTAAACQVGEHRPQHGCIGASSREQVIEAAGIEYPAHRPPHRHPIRHVRRLSSRAGRRREVRRAVAILPCFGNTRRRMLRRIAALVGALLLPALVCAQSINLNDTTRGQLRQRTDGVARPTAKAKLDDALRDFNAEDQPTRLEGVRQLGNVEDASKAIGYLLEAANDPDSAIRLKAIDVLGQIRSKEAVAPLVQQLFMRDTDEVTKQHILVSLGRIGDPRATRPILDFLARDGDQGIRGNAIFALGDIGDEAALEPLGRIAEQSDDPSLRAVAQAAMHKIRDRPAPEVVPSALLQERLRAQAQAAAKQSRR
jgi:HEAT repeat protein